VVEPEEPKAPALAKPGSSYSQASFRAQRKPRHVVPAENIPMGELDSHYTRLQRLGKGNPWKRGFLGVAVLLAGGVVGAVLAGPGWTWPVKAAAGIAIVCGLGWRGVSETEAEDIANLCSDYKSDILDSIELVPVENAESTARG
jgi:hypothetical protein